MRDTFCTINYKGFYIQTCFDNGKEEIKVKGKTFRSIHAAKIYITTKAIPEHDKMLQLISLF